MKDDCSKDLARGGLRHSRYQCPRSPQLAHLQIAFSLAIGIFDMLSEAGAVLPGRTVVLVAAHTAAASPRAASSSRTTPS